MVRNLVYLYHLLPLFFILLSSFVSYNVIFSSAIGYFHKMNNIFSNVDFISIRLLCLDFHYVRCGN